MVWYVVCDGVGVVIPVDGVVWWCDTYGMQVQMVWYLVWLVCDGVLVIYHKQVP